MPATNAFDDLKSGARGFILNQKEGDPSNFLGINGDKYTYPKTVKEGRQKDITKIPNAQQWTSDVIFGGAPYSTVPSTNNLRGTKYTRTVYNINKPYLTSAGITGTDLFTYFNSNSFEVRNIEYSAFNLKDSSFISVLLR
jgi:hypothetical protein